LKGPILFTNEQRINMSMDKEFIDQMQTIPLTLRQYLSMRLGREYSWYRITSYFVRRKPRSEWVNTDDPLLRVVLNYHLGYVEFCMLSLDGNVITTDDYYQVGMFDHSGLLCISRLDGTVQIRRDVYHTETEFNTDYFCATDSAAFLQALLPAAAYWERCFIDNFKSNKKLAEGMLEYCVGIAGGESEDFFRVLLDV
jgi:hypothetical protein